MSMLLIASLCFSLVGGDPDGPPGLAFVRGGHTRIGSTTQEVETLATTREELAFVLAGEAPQHVREVEDFFLMPTEVTNEQYVLFVRATGARPPRSWGVAALRAGQAAFLEEQARAKQAARPTGQPFEPRVFDPERWWDENWKTAAWSVPPDQAGEPVVFVGYADAQRYARWAGLRLMTEFEFQRAARGDSARTYPWGEDWDDRKFCQSLLSGMDEPAPVGSYPAGSTNGFFDLAGNVWEWTSSPFEPYPGYQPLHVKKGKRSVDGLAPFDPEQRVIVGGSFQMDQIGVRVSTRMNADRSQSTNAIGFRCAASPRPGMDAAAALFEQVLHGKVPGDAALAPANALVLRHWKIAQTRVSVPGYAVIASYGQILFCPRAELAAATLVSLADQSVAEGPIFLGFVDLPRPLAEPELDAGTYLVAWRAAGELPHSGEVKQSLQLDAQEPRVTPFHEVAGFAADRSCYVLYNARGEPQVAFEAPAPRLERLRAGSVAIEYDAPDPKTVDPKTSAKDAPAAKFDLVRFSIPIVSASTRSKALIFDLVLKVAPGTFDASWR